MSNRSEKDIKYIYIKVVWVRLLRVVYYSLVLFVTLVSLWTLWDLKPEQVMDYAEIHCLNGKIYNSDEQEIYLYSEYVSSLDNAKIKYLCADKIKLRNKNTGEIIEISKDKLQQAKQIYGLTEEDIQRILTDPDKIPKNNSLIFKYKTEGDWIVGITYASLVLVAGLAVLEIIKRTLRYIFVGKGFFS